MPEDFNEELGKDEEYEYTPRGKADEVYDRWREFIYVFNDLAYISSEVISNEPRYHQLIVTQAGEVDAFQTNLGPGRDPEIFYERLEKAQFLLKLLNAEAAAWSERTGNPAPDLRDVNEAFDPMKLDAHLFAHRTVLDATFKKMNAFKDKYLVYSEHYGTFMSKAKRIFSHRGWFGDRPGHSLAARGRRVPWRGGR